MSQTLESKNVGDTENGPDKEVLNSKTNLYEGIDFMSHSKDSTWRFDFSNAKSILSALC